MTLNLLARLSFAVLVALPVYAQAETDEAPSAPDRNPFRAKASGANEVPAAKPVLPGDAPTVAWTDDEVAAAKADCAKILSGVALDYEPLPPLKEGICGAPAPILLKSIGSDPKVAIDPPATVTCAVAAGVSAWLSKTVQPEANALLGTQVVKLRNASSYVCRNRYGGATTPLSEHALANALDVSEFVFASGEHITVLDGWPRVVTVPPLPLPNPTRVAAETTGSINSAPAARPKTVEAVEVTKVKATAKMNPFVVPKDAKTNPFVRPTAVTKMPPPTPPAEAMAPETQSPSERKGEFVKTVHDDACHVFGTTLGPEANEAHKNHFHFDMKARRRSALCE
jgi:hypothetical protein